MAEYDEKKNKKRNMYLQQLVGKSKTYNFVQSTYKLNSKNLKKNLNDQVYAST